MLVHDFMGADVLDVKQVAIVRKPESFIEGERLDARIEPDKIATTLFQVFNRKSHQSLSDTLTAIVVVRGHAPQSIRKARTEGWVRFLDESRNRDQLVGVKKAIVIGGNQIVARIDALFFRKKRFQDTLADGKRVGGFDFSNFVLEGHPVLNRK